VKPENEKFYRTTQFIYYFGLTHLALVFIFHFLGIKELAAFNMFISVPAFTAALILNRLGRHNAAFALAFFELYFHQVLATYLLGWDMGMQHALIYLAGVSFFNPTWKKAVQIPILALICLTYGIMHHVFRTGVYEYPDDLSRLVYAGSGITIIIVLSLLISYYNRSAYESERKLQAAHKEARSLLLNILPEMIADKLSRERKGIAERYEETTILFSDIVGFTELASGLSAEELVRILNGIFSRFDSIVEELGLEKIKTIGDGYMAASGVPRRREDHAAAAVRCGMRMLSVLEEFNGENGLHLALRVGIHSGSVIAGVIGKNKFSYDLWGDTVNIASRMESHGLPGRVHISESAYRLVKAEFSTEEREPISVKGKGLMKTYLVSGGTSPR
jgi:class 3 adenylate cyclase